MNNDVTSAVLAASELQSMLDGTRDDAPSFGALIKAVLGDERPSLGSIRRAVEDVGVAALLRRPTEDATGRYLRAVPDLAEAIAEVLAGVRASDPKSIGQAQALSASLVGRVTTAAV